MNVCVLEHFDGELSSVWFCDTNKLDVTKPLCKKFKEMLEDPKNFYGEEGEDCFMEYDEDYYERTTWQCHDIALSEIKPPCHIDKLVQLFEGE